MTGPSLAHVWERKAGTMEGFVRMMMRSGKINLKQAQAAGQVAAISHCGDTYTVTTADGKTQKVWEFSLRFKTDSRKKGRAGVNP